MTSTNLKLLTTKDISEIYGIPRTTAYELLHIRGCPVVKGGNGKRFLVEQGAFEDWLTKRRMNQVAQ